MKKRAIAIAVIVGIALATCAIVQHERITLDRRKSIVEEYCTVRWHHARLGEFLYRYELRGYYEAGGRVAAIEYEKRCEQAQQDYYEVLKRATMGRSWLRRNSRLESFITSAQNAILEFEELGQEFAELAKGPPAG